METSHRDSDTMALTDLAKEVLLYMALLTDYISYYWNAFLCMLFHYILGGPNPLPVHEASPTSHPAVLVAEASVGVGRDAAITLARHGYTVFATVRDQEESEDLTREFSQFDNQNQGCLVPIAMDATNKNDIQNAYNIVWNMLGGKTPFVGLVNSTEQVIHTPMEVASDVAFHESFEANFFRVINLTKAFLPLLRESHGRVVNIGSISAWHTAATMGVHASAKAALRALTRTWGQELRSLGVGMSLVETGIVDTQLTQQVNRNFLSFTTFPADSRYYEIQHNAEPTVIQTYEHQYRVIGRHCNEILGNAAPPALVTDAIMNALTAPYPKATYYVGVDARFLATLNWLLGERTVDAIQAKFLGF